jgi:hypothetical protein
MGRLRNIHTLTRVRISGGGERINSLVKEESRLKSLLSIVVSFVISPSEGIWRLRVMVAVLLAAELIQTETEREETALFEGGHVEAVKKIVLEVLHMEQLSTNFV